jgi:phage portal protein BeeE
MSLWSWLRGDDVVSGDETRTLPRPENELPLYAGYLGSPISATEALAISDVWAAMRVVCDAASSLPLHVYRHREDGGRERVTSGQLVELLDKPGPAMTQADLVSCLMAHLVIWGAGYLGKYRQQGEVTQLGPLHPELVRPELDGGRLRFRYSPGTTDQRLLTERDLTYVRGLSVDGLHGLSVVQHAADVLGLSRELVKHALSYFQVVDTGGVPRPAGVLEVDPDLSSDQRAGDIGVVDRAAGHEDSVGAGVGPQLLEHPTRRSARTSVRRSAARTSTARASASASTRSRGRGTADDRVREGAEGRDRGHVRRLPGGECGAADEK